MQRRASRSVPRCPEPGEPEAQPAGGPLEQPSVLERSRVHGIEQSAFFNIQLGYGLEMGTQIGFKLLHG